MPTVPRPLTARFEAALAFASSTHRDQARKGTDVPYVAHLLAVSSLVLEHGADEDTAIAALLHDAAEDQGGSAMLEEIRSRFGPRVARIVEGCTDALEAPKPPWRERKERYLLHVRDMTPEVRLVSMADKLHNARTILADYRRIGETLWTRFRGGREGSLWYYRSVTDALADLGPHPLAEELHRTVAELEKEAAARRLSADDSSANA